MVDERPAPCRVASRASGRSGSAPARCDSAVVDAGLEQLPISIGRRNRGLRSLPRPRSAGRAVGVRRKPVCEHAPGGAGTDNDVVEGPVARHRLPVHPCRAHRPSSRLQRRNGFSWASTSSAAAGAGGGRRDGWRSPRTPRGLPRRAFLLPPREADEDDGRIPIYEVSKRPHHQGAPETQVPAHLMRIALALEAGQRERRVKGAVRRTPPNDPRAHRAPPDRPRQIRWLPVPPASLQAPGVKGLAGARGENHLNHHRTLGENILSSSRQRRRCRPRSPAGRECGAGIRVLAQDHAAHVLWRDAVEGTQHVRPAGAPGKTIPRRVGKIGPRARARDRLRPPQTPA